MIRLCQNVEEQRNYDTEIKAVLFDMDGLMFDTERIGRECLLKAGHILSMKCLVPEKGSLSQEREAEADAKEEIEDELAACYEELCGLNAKDTLEYMGSRWGYAWAQECLALTDALMEDYLKLKGIPAKKGLRRLLAALQKRGISAAIVSASSMDQIRENLEKNEIHHEFACIVCGDMVRHSKPDPEGYLLAIRRLDLSPEQCIVLEDSRNGLIAGARAGCRTVLVPDMWVPEEGEAAEFITWIGEDLEDVIALLPQE